MPASSSDPPAAGGKRRKTAIVVRQAETLPHLAKPVEAIFVRPTKSAITLGMHRTYNVLLANAVAQGLAVEKYTIATSELARNLEFDSNNHDFLKDTARKLASATVEWDYLTDTGRRQWGVSAMIASVQIEEGGVIEYSFSPHLKAKLLNPDVYARLNLRLQNRFRSRHSLALYEYCVRYRDNPSHLSARLPWQQWAEMLVGSADPEALALREYKYFARDVLKPAIAEVNAVADDIEIEAIVEKEGRRVKRLQFRITTRAVPAAVVEAAAALPEALRARLAALGLVDAEIGELAREHETAALEAALEYTERRQRNPRLSPLANAAAYLRQALAKRYAKPAPAAAPAGPAGRARAAAPAAAAGAVAGSGTSAGSGAVARPGGAAGAVPAGAAGPGGRVSALRARFLSHRAEQARAMFAEMDERAQRAAFEEFLATLAGPARAMHEKGGPLAAKTVKTFTAWLAERTWGEPTPEQLLEFAAEQIGAA